MTIFYAYKLIFSLCFNFKRKFDVEFLLLGGQLSWARDILSDGTKIPSWINRENYWGLHKEDVLKHVARRLGLEKFDLSPGSPFLVTVENPPDGNSLKLIAPQPEA